MYMHTSPSALHWFARSLLAFEIDRWLAASFPSFSIQSVFPKHRICFQNVVTFKSASRKLNFNPLSSFSPPSLRVCRRCECVRSFFLLCVEYGQERHLPVDTAAALHTPTSGQTTTTRSWACPAMRPPPTSRSHITSWQSSGTPTSACT